MSRHILTAQEAAKYLNISYWMLLEKARKGVIPSAKIGARVLFSQKGLDDWISVMEAQSINKPEPDTQIGKLRKIQG